MRGIKIKNADGTFSNVGIINPINDDSVGSNSTWSSKKIKEYTPEAELLADIVVDDSIRQLDYNNRPYIDMLLNDYSTDKRYHHLIFRIEYPEMVRSWTNNLLQLGNRNASYNNLLEFTANNYKVLAGTVDILPNGYFKTVANYQANDVYCEGVKDGINCERYITAQNSDFCHFRLLVRQDTTSIPNGTTIKIWGWE